MVFSYAGQQIAASTKKISVLPSRSEAPARTLRSKPSASILTTSGRGALDAETISFRVFTGTEIVGAPASTSRGCEGTAIVAIRNGKRQDPGLVCHAGVDPGDFVAAIEQILHVHFQLVLRLD